MEFQNGLNMARIMHCILLTYVHKILSSQIGKYFWDEQCFLHSSSLSDNTGG